MLLVPLNHLPKLLSFFFSKSVVFSKLLIRFNEAFLVFNFVIVNNFLDISCSLPCPRLFLRFFLTVSFLFSLFGLFRSLRLLFSVILTFSISFLSWFFLLAFIDGHVLNDDLSYFFSGRGVERDINVSFFQFCKIGWMSCEDKHQFWVLSKV